MVSAKVNPVRSLLLLPDCPVASNGVNPVRDRKRLFPLTLPSPPRGEEKGEGKIAIVWTVLILDINRYR